MTYNKIVKKTLEEIKQKVMRMPESVNIDTLLKIAKHNDRHIESTTSFMNLWLWIWGHKAICEERDLFFLLGVLECDACCRIFRTSPSSMEAFIRESPSVQSWFSEKKNKLTGALALAEDAGDKLRVDVITILLRKLEKQRKGEII